MENIIEEVLEEFAQYYMIHNQNLTRDDIEQKEKGISRMRSMAATYFKDDNDYMDHLQEEIENYQKAKYSIAAAFIKETTPLLELYRKGFGPTTLKEYCIDFKEFTKDIVFIETQAHKR